MVNRKKLAELLEDRKTFWADNGCLDGISVYQEQYKQPLIDALGDDEEDIKSFISSCKDKDLLYMTEFFEDIYGKFMNDEMWDFLDKMETKAGLHN